MSYMIGRPLLPYSSKPDSYSPELFLNVCSFLSNELSNMALVSQNWRHLVSDYRLFRHYRLPLHSYRGICFHEIFEGVAVAHPARVAVIRAGHSNASEMISYADLDRRANILANCLISLKLPPESAIGIYLPTSIEYIICLIGILKAGHAFVPLSIDTGELPLARLGTICQFGNIQHVLTSHSYAQVIQPGVKVNTLLIEDLKNHSNTKRPNRVVPRQSLAYITFSSGTTGVPKLIEIPHEGIVHRIYAHHQILKMSHHDNVSQFAKNSFDAFIMEVMMTLAIGARLTIVPPEIKLNVAALGEFYNAEKITIGIFTPGMLGLLEPHQFPLMREIITTGQHISYELYKKWNFKLKNGYGPAEFTICTSIGENTVAEIEPHVGKPIYGTRAYIVDDDSKELKESKESKTGELYLAGAGLARGYRNQPELTKQSFLKIRHERVYKTGDLVEWLPNGNFRIKGRKDRAEKIHGQKMCPEEIEVKLEEFPGIKKAAVVFKQLYKAVSKTSYIIAFLETNEDFASSFDEIYHYLSNVLPRYMLPARWAMVKIPLTTNLKTDYASLGNFDSKLLKKTNATSLVAPRNAIEEKVMEIVTKILGSEERSIFYDLFHAGADSISMARLNDEVQKAFLIKSETHCLYYAPTVAGISRYVQYLSYTPAQTLVPLKKLAHKDQGPALFCIHPMTGKTNIYTSNFLNDCKQNFRMVYGIDAREIEEENILLMAFDYIRIIKSKQPDGPYHILGYSSGAVIAYAISILMPQPANRKEVFLYLVDAPHPLLVARMNSLQFISYILEALTMACEILGIDKKLLPTSSVLNLPSKVRQVQTAFDLIINQLPVHSSQATQLQLYRRIKLAEINMLYALSIINLPDLTWVKTTIFSASKTVREFKCEADLGWGKQHYCETYNADHFEILGQLAKKSPTMHRLLTDMSLLSPVEDEKAFVYRESKIHKLPRPLDEKFIERNVIVDTLYQHIMENETGSIQLISGMEGFGKTTIATQLMRKFNQKKIMSYLVWFNNYSDSIKAEFFEFAESLGINTNLQSKPEDIKEQLYAKFDEHKIGSILVVFNHVSSQEQINPYVAILKNIPHTRVHIVITTIDGNIRFPGMLLHPLKELSDEEAKKLLDKQFPDAKEMGALIKSIGKIPLDLDHVAADIKKQGISVQKYIDRFNESKIVEDSKISNSFIPTSTIVKLKLEEVDKHEKCNKNYVGLARVIMFLSYLNPNDIPYTLIYHFSKDDETLANNIISYLRGISILVLGKSSKNIFYSIHVKIQELVRDYYKSQQIIVLRQLLEYFHARLVDTTQAIYRQRDNWDEIWGILNHARSVAEFSTRHKELQLSAIQLLVKIALYIRCLRSECCQAVDLLEIALNYYDTCMCEDIKLTCRIFIQLGIMLMLISSYERSKIVLHKALSLSKHVQLDPSEEAHLYNGLCGISIYFNEYSSAIEHGKKSITFIGADQGRLAICHEILGLAYLGPYQIAEAEFHTNRAYELATTQRDLTGKMISATAAAAETRLCQAITACCKMDYKAADSLCKESSDLYRQVGKQDTYEMAEMLVWWGWAKLGAKDYRNSKNLSNQALRLYENVLSPLRNQRIIFANVLLALSYDCIGETDQAIKTLDDAIKIYREQAIYKFHRTVIIGFIPIFNWQDYPCKSDIKSREAFLDRISLLYEGASFECAFFMSVLAETHLKSSNFIKAEEYFSKALKKCNQVVAELNRCMPDANKQYLLNRIKQCKEKNAEKIPLDQKNSQPADNRSIFKP